MSVSSPDFSILMLMLFLESYLESNHCVGLKFARHAGARADVMQILRLLVVHVTLGIFHVRVYVSAFARNPDVFSK